MKIESEPTDLVWLPVSLVKKIKDVQDSKGIENEIMSYIAETRLDLKQQIESIDDDVLLYRAHMIKIRDAFKKAKNEELEACYQLWQDFDKELPKTRQFIKEAIDTIEPLKNEVNNLRTELDNLNKTISAINIDRMLGFLTVLKDCNTLINEDKKLLSFIINNYKK